MSEANSVFNHLRVEMNQKMDIITLDEIRAGLLQLDGVDKVSWTKQSELMEFV